MLISASESPHLLTDRRSNNACSVRILVGHSYLLLNQYRQSGSMNILFVFESDSLVGWLSRCECHSRHPPL
jgi:hypothetical protein